MELKIAMLVLSCDSYCDLWDDFFGIRVKYWRDCPYKWYIVTESKDFNKYGVEVIKCGKKLNWAGRCRHAIELIDAKYFGIFLEDYFITDNIDSDLVNSNVLLMDEKHIDLINMSDVFYTIINSKNKEYFSDHLIKIPQNFPYGLSTASAIWSREFLLKKLGKGDYSAWQFEIDRYNEAKSEDGYGGFLLCDDRMPFHVSTIPVVTQGKYTPAAIRFFRKKGITVNSNNRLVMSEWDYSIFNLKLKLSNIKFARRILRWIGAKFFGLKYFTK